MEQQKFVAAKELEIKVRNEIDGDTWQNIFFDATYDSLQLGPQSKEVGIITEYFEKTIGIKTQDCVLSANFAKWAATTQIFWFHKTGDKKEVRHAMGELPRIETKQAIIPNKGDLRDLVLPGGGTLALQLWAGIHRKVFQIQKWMKTLGIQSPHMKHALQ